MSFSFSNSSRPNKNGLANPLAISCFKEAYSYNTNKSCLAHSRNKINKKTQDDVGIAAAITFVLLESTISSWKEE